MIEEWRDAAGYEGIYEVSRCGKVRSKEGKTTFGEFHGWRTWKQRELKQSTCKQNFRRVYLCKEGVERPWLVHRLVAKAFLPSDTKRKQVNHKDGSRINNHVDNLEWCTPRENVNHAYDLGLTSNAHAVILEDKKTGERHAFRSKRRASVFLGRSEPYLTNKLISGTGELEGYIIHDKNI